MSNGLKKLMRQKANLFFIDEFCMQVKKVFYFPFPPIKLLVSGLR